MIEGITSHESSIHKILFHAISARKKNLLNSVIKQVLQVVSSVKIPPVIMEDIINLL